MMDTTLIAELIPQSLPTREARRIRPRKLARWVGEVVEVYSLDLSGEETIFLIKPAKPLSFEQLAFIAKHVRARLKGIALLVADDLNPMFRSLFVRNKVPFIYGNKSIYSPELGLKIFNYKRMSHSDEGLVDTWIRPFDLKLIAGYLTGFLQAAEFNLDDLKRLLAEHGYSCSKSKLSTSVSQLIKLGYLETEGAGPNRKVRFLGKREVLAELSDASIKPFFKTHRISIAIPAADAFLSHESALARYSSLANPKATRIAMSRAAFKKATNVSEGDGIELSIVDVFNEPPELFSVDHRLVNPIELYMQMKYIGDERIQLSLEEMLVNSI